MKEIICGDHIYQREELAEKRSIENVLKIIGKNYLIQVFSHEELQLYEYNVTNAQYCYFTTAS